MCLTPLASASLLEAQSYLAEKIFNITPDQAHEQRICIHCKQPIFFFNPDQQEMVGEFMTYQDSEEGYIWSWEGLNEYKISALCEHCFESITMEQED